MKGARSLAIVALALGVSVATAEPQPTEGATDIGPAIDEAVQPLLKSKKGVGIVVGVIDRRGQRVFGYGDVAVNGAKAPDGDTVFEVGSITKVFTTAVLAQMARDRKLKLDDPVKDYLPPEANVPHRNDKDITLLHLATHTSGLPEAPTDIRWHVLLRPGDWHNPYAHYGTKQLYAFLGKYRLDRDPGDSYEYSNVGLGLLGMALTHRAKAHDYDELIRRAVGGPLGLKDTGVALSAGQRARFAQGHDEDGEPTAAWDFETMEGFAALRSTANDLLLFLSANLGLKRTKLQAALEDCQKARRDTPDKQVRVGLGWHVLQLQGASDPVICHSGETEGGRAFLGLCKESGVGVVVLSNSNQLGKKIDLIGLTVLGKLKAGKEQRPPGRSR
jgi:CubicO group peptidase (beta-lactamase class C family)